MSERCRTRLRLTWSDQGEHIDTREDRNARAAACLVRGLARRVVAVPRGGQLPRVLRQQRWSPLNVPLMWAAAGQRASVGLADRSVLQGDGFCRISWWNQSRKCGSEDRMECTSRDHAKLHHGFRGISNWSSWKSHRRQSPGVDSSRSERDRCKGTNSEICAESWERLDEVDLDVLFLQKIPMLKICPRFLRGRLRHCPIWDSVKAAMSVRAKAEAKSPGVDGGKLSVIAQGADQMRACATRVNGEW